MNHRGRILIGVLVLASSACGRVSGDRGGIAHPTGPEDLLLRVERGAVFDSLSWSLRGLPSLSLYGDGRIVVPVPRGEADAGTLLQGLTVRHVSDEGVQAILRAAREAGLHGPDRRFEVEGVDDARAIEFTAVTDGQPHVTVAFALGEEDPEYAPAGDRLARRALLEFASILSRLERLLPAGSIGEEEPLPPDRLRIFTNPYGNFLHRDFLPSPNVEDSEIVTPPSASLPEIEWPLDEPIRGFGEPTEGPIRCGSVEGSELDVFLAAAERASEFTPWVSDGRRYALVVRPLLPDDPDCP